MLLCCNKSGAAINREQLAEVPPGFRRKHIQPDVLCLPTHCVFNWDVCSSGNCFADYSTHSPSPPVWHSPSGQSETQTSPRGPLTWPRRQLEICQAWPTGRCAFLGKERQVRLVSVKLRCGSLPSPRRHCQTLVLAGRVSRACFSSISAKLRPELFLNEP